MPVTISFYNHTMKKLLGQEVTLSTLKAQLLSASASFVASHTALTSVNNAGAYEVSGNGWTVGGMTIGSVVASIVTTNDAKIAGSNISVTATGGDIGPASAAVIYDDTDAGDAPLAYIDFGGPQQAGVGTDFKINWNASGIITGTYT